MKTVSIGEFKANFSTYADKVQKGLEIIITHGRKKKKIFKVVPIRDEKPFKRKLGTLEGKVKAVFKDDFKITTEGFLNL